MGERFEKVAMGAAYGVILALGLIASTLSCRIGSASTARIGFGNEEPSSQCAIAAGEDAADEAALSSRNRRFSFHGDETGGGIVVPGVGPSAASPGVDANGRLMDEDEPSCDAEGGDRPEVTGSPASPSAGGATDEEGIGNREAE